MPPSHPRPEDLTALGTALSAAAESAATGGEALLDTMVSVGDHATQTDGRADRPPEVREHGLRVGRDGSID